MEEGFMTMLRVFEYSFREEFPTNWTYVQLCSKNADSPGVRIQVARAPLDSALCTGMHLAGDEERLLYYRNMENYHIYSISGKASSLIGLRKFLLCFTLDVVFLRELAANWENRAHAAAISYIGAYPSSCSVNLLTATCTLLPTSVNILTTTCPPLSA